MMLKNSGEILIVFVLILFFSVSTAATGFGGALCAGSSATLDCLKQNSSALYSTNPDRFWKILNEAADKAARCKEPSDTIRFLELVQITLDGALYEFYSEKIENLCIAKPKCFFDAMTALKKEEQVANVKMLRTPLISDPKEIRRVFEAHKDNKKYKHITDLYFNPN